MIMTDSCGTVHSADNYRTVRPPLLPSEFSDQADKRLAGLYEEEVYLLSISLFGQDVV